MKSVVVIFVLIASTVLVSGDLVDRPLKHPKLRTSQDADNRRYLKRSKDKQSKGTATAKATSGSECVKRKPDQLTFQYFGGQGQVSEYQPLKATCGNQIFPTSTTVTVYGQVFEMNPGQKFTIIPDGGKFDANTEFVFSSGDVSSCTIHTSCSQPLAVGDRFGPFKLIDGPPGSKCFRDPINCICCEPVCECEAIASYDNEILTIDFDYCGKADPGAFDWIGIYPCDADTMVADDAWAEYVFYTDVWQHDFVKGSTYVDEWPLMYSYTCGSPGKSSCQHEDQNTEWPSKGQLVLDPAEYKNAKWAFPGTTKLRPGCYKAHMERDTEISWPPTPVVCREWAEANEFFVT